MPQPIKLQLAWTRIWPKANATSGVGQRWSNREVRKTRPKQPVCKNMAAFVLEGCRVSRKPWRKLRCWDDNRALSTHKAHQSRLLSRDSSLHRAVKLPNNWVLIQTKDQEGQSITSSLTALPMTINIHRRDTKRGEIGPEWSLEMNGHCLYISICPEYNSHINGLPWSHSFPVFSPSSTLFLLSFSFAHLLSLPAPHTLTPNLMWQPPCRPSFRQQSTKALWTTWRHWRCE